MLVWQREEPSKIFKCKISPSNWFWGIRILDRHVPGAKLGVLAFRLGVRRWGVGVGGWFLQPGLQLGTWRGSSASFEWGTNGVRTRLYGAVQQMHQIFIAKKYLLPITCTWNETSSLTSRAIKPGVEWGQAASRHSRENERAGSLFRGDRDGCIGQQTCQRRVRLWLHERHMAMGERDPVALGCHSWGASWMSPSVTMSGLHTRNLIMRVLAWHEAPSWKFYMPRFLVFSQQTYCCCCCCCLYYYCLRFLDEETEVCGVRWLFQNDTVAPHVELRQTGSRSHASNDSCACSPAPCLMPIL